MAHIEELRSAEELRAHLMTLDEPSLLGQQLVQQGAIHALSTLLANGGSATIARGMLDSLQRNMEVVAAVAQAKGFNRLFDAPTDGVAEGQVQTIQRHTPTRKA